MKEIVKELKSYVPEEPLASVKARLGLDRVVRLSANENPYGTSPKVRQAILDYVNNNDANYYPDGYAQSLRTALAQFWGFGEEQFVIGVGLDEVISLVSRVFLKEGDSVLVSQPAFSEYALNGRIEGATIKTVNCNPETGHFDFDGLYEAVDASVKLVWLCNPNNPTGTYETVEDMRAFIKRVPQDCLVIIDEAYIDFVTDVPVPTAMELLKEFPNVALMRTFSKAYGLANYRVGYMIVAPELANYVQTVRLPYNLNTLSQVAAEAALADQDFLAETIERNRRERDLWEALLTELGIHFYHSQANFIYMKVGDEKALAEAWLKAGYQVRQGLGAGALRVTLPKAEDGVVMRQILKEYYINCTSRI